MDFLLWIMGTIAVVVFIGGVTIGVLKVMDNEPSSYKPNDFIDVTDYESKQVAALKRRIKELEKDIASFEQQPDMVRTQTYEPHHLAAINTFERHNINLPTEVLDEIVYHNPKTTQDTIKLIEVSRVNLKNELSKKLPKI